MIISHVKEPILLSFLVFYILFQVIFNRKILL